MAAVIEGAHAVKINRIAGEAAVGIFRDIGVNFRNLRKHPQHAGPALDLETAFVA